SQFKLIPGVGSAIGLLNDIGLRVVVVSNQSGVARGYLTEEDVQKVNRKMINELGEHCSIDAIYYCPHHPEIGSKAYKKDCDCRKPNPGMLKFAAQDLNLDLERSFMIGDKMDDVLAGYSVGCETILVLTGKGRDELESYTTPNKKYSKNRIKPDNIASDLSEAVLIILKKVQKSSR
ncbi:HAD-IIIA family hydrolase, partial [Candidatus Bathyarchaeota archaeon]|nr:HAD-IIIA family hydrolase [Candidatus Bathyarchaeota archaeon]